MKIVFVLAGTEGDARPNVALAQGLKDDGQDVVVLTSRDFERLVTEAGVTFVPLTADFRRMMRGDKASLDGRTAIVTAWHGFRHLREMARSWVAEARPVIENADLIIGSGGALYFASALAESCNVPFVRTVFQPVEPSPEIPPVMLPPPPFRMPGPINLLLHAVTRHVGWQIGRPVMARLRAELGLGKPSLLGPWSSHRLGRAPILHAFSREVVSPPKSWRAHAATTGFWILHRSDDRPSRRLQEFLGEGPTPIYVGFGSMVIRDLARFGSIISDGLRIAGDRAVVLSGWGDLAQHLGPTADMLVLQTAPHEWLFPRTRLAVHHCGAGTTASVLRAGIPSVPVPFLFDQFFWADRLHRLGVACRPLRRKRMTARAFADAIAQADAPPIHGNARRLGERLRAEDGVANAIATLRRWSLLPCR